MRGKIKFFYDNAPLVAILGAIIYIVIRIVTL